MVDSVLLWWTPLTAPCRKLALLPPKAFERGLNPIVVVNKIDRVGARPDWVINQVLICLTASGATEEQLDFPVIYTSAIKRRSRIDGGQIGQ